MSLLNKCMAVACFCSCLTSVAASARGENPLRLAVDAQRVVVRNLDRVVLKYRYADVTYKPYVEQLVSQAGVEPLRDSPHDHKHHHALMFAVAVDGVNFWEEQKAPGRQYHRGLIDAQVAGDDDLCRAGFTERIDWVNPADDKLIVTEERTIEVYAAGDIHASLMTWQSRLMPAPGKRSAELTGSEYFGLGVRFVESMDTAGRFVNAEGKSGVADTNGQAAPWCAYAASADDKPVTIAMFDHPKNVRHPATWFTMDSPFAYLAATLHLHREPLVLTADGPPLVLRYGVAIFDGTAEPARIAEHYQRWVAIGSGRAATPGKPGL